jgi:two-component system alkaline phosphatase synthesis response regulator PhoP
MESWISVLVVEDEEHIRQIIKYNLELEGFAVQVAKDGITGLEMAHSDPKPTVILLDWMMPGMDGMQVLSALRRDEYTEKIPVIMLTAKRTIGSIEDAFDAKADGYITKPFDPTVLGEEIRKKLKECLSNRRKYWKDEGQEKPDSSRKRDPANLVG